MVQRATVALQLLLVAERPSPVVAWQPLAVHAVWRPYYVVLIVTRPLMVTYTYPPDVGRDLQFQAPQVLKQYGHLAGRFLNYAAGAVLGQAGGVSSLVAVGETYGMEPAAHRTDWPVRYCPPTA